MCAIPAFRWRFYMEYNYSKPYIGYMVQILLKQCFQIFTYGNELLIDSNCYLPLTIRWLQLWTLPLHIRIADKIQCRDNLTWFFGSGLWINTIFVWSCHCCRVYEWQLLGFRNSSWCVCLSQSILNNSVVVYYIFIIQIFIKEWCSSKWL